MRFRLKEGGRIDRTRRLGFTFNGRRYEGFSGDTLASALIASGTHLTSRSFKYHRPRGILSAGAEEPSALVQLGVGARTEPNLRATQVELYDGLSAAGVNAWPSAAFDLGAWTGRLAPLFPAGFYYKTFLWPASFWKFLYEPAIRRMAGLGRAPDAPDPDSYDRMFVHCDVLVVGGGPAGHRRSAQPPARAARTWCWWTSRRRSAARCRASATASTARTARPGPRTWPSGSPPCRRCACSPAPRSSATTTTTR